MMMLLPSPTSESSPPSCHNHQQSCISTQYLGGQFKCCLLLCLSGLIFFYLYVNNSYYYNTLYWPYYWNEECIRSNSDNEPTKHLNDSALVVDHLLSTTTNDWSRMCAGQVTPAEMERLFPSTIEPKFLLGSWGGLCGGLGNQMWRFASMYGIGKPYGRKPVYKKDQRCVKRNGPHEVDGDDDEIAKLFPVYASQQSKFIKVNNSETFTLNGFASDCCKYDDPQRVKLSRIKEKYLQINTYYFQSYKFFEARRQEIRQIFQFSPAVCSEVAAYRTELFRGDKAHKLCAHTRIEDFKQFSMETNKEFMEKAIHFVHRELKKKFNHVSLVLLGAEKHFLVNVTVDRNLIPNVYLPKAMPRGHDLSFGTTACDSLLITAPASTFSWWMAYLMADEAPIFYNSALEKTPYTRENFLPEWTPLQLLNGSIVFD